MTSRRVSRVHDVTGIVDSADAAAFPKVEQSHSLDFRPNERHAATVVVRQANHLLAIIDRMCRYRPDIHNTACCGPNKRSIVKIGTDLRMADAYDGSVVVYVHS
jgi:hypothetical protein